MLALFRIIRYISNKRKLQKQKLKIQNRIYFVVANAIRYPPQRRDSPFMGEFLFAFYLLVFGFSLNNELIV